MTSGPEDVRKWRDGLAQMRDKWSRSVSAAEQLVRREISTVEAWRGSLDALGKLRLELQKRNLWYHGRPDLLGIIGRGRRELYHSQMLAWLMDPGTPSGLGIAFLKEFLLLVDENLGDLTEDELYQVEVACEVTGKDARTDLLIRGERFTVAIEVKVDADEQTSQCERIYQDYQDSPNPRFVFLTPGGRSPNTATGAARERFEKLSFKDVRERLVGVTRDRKKPPLGQLSTLPLSPLSGGTATCLSYLSTLDREFG